MKKMFEDIITDGEKHGVKVYIHKQIKEGIFN